MAVEGKIAMYARGEMPLTWDALAKEGVLGDQFLESKVNSVMTSLFGAPISTAEQEALDERVAEYAGKLVALSLIVPARDYWNKQASSLGATGRNENKAYLNRAAELTKMREELIAATRAMWPEVEPFLPNRRVNRVASVPRTSQVVGVATPDPFAFEPPYEVS